MSKTYALQAEARERAGKGVARALRREKKIPAVIYGDGKDVLPISLMTKDVTMQYMKGHMFTSLCEVTVGGSKHLVLARDVQLDPVRDFVLHVDFLRVSPKTKIHVQVPVHFKNQEACPGLKAGGVLNIVHHELDLLVQATNIPDEIVVDLTKYNVGDAIHLKDIQLPAGAATDYDADETIATVAAPRSMREEVEEAPAADAAAAAPAAGEKKEEAKK